MLTDSIIETIVPILRKYNREVGSGNSNNPMVLELANRLYGLFTRKGTGQEELLAKRSEIYGPPQEMHAAMAKAWGAFLGIEISDWQAAGMMAIFKILRARRVFHQDNYDDAKVYLGFMEEFQRPAVPKKEEPEPLPCKHCGPEKSDVFHDYWQDKLPSGHRYICKTCGVATSWYDYEKLAREEWNKNNIVPNQSMPED